ncbi:hypothetical protein Barb6_00227 [Bacteroidales bacterium Barb6]|nr:hypothetical protein Barb6_00227 [Bacteroidales bacterium Barb6]
MLITIKKDTCKQKIDKLLINPKPRKAFHAKMFLGKVKWEEDACQYQKRLRNEWDQDNV